MITRIEICSENDIDELNRIAEGTGIRFHLDLLGRPYAIVDTRARAADRSRHRHGRTCKICKATRERAIEMKRNGATVRQIARELFISTGSVSKITRGQK